MSRKRINLIISFPQKSSSAAFSRFVLKEADVSSDAIASSDEEEGRHLDKYDASFVNDRLDPTQAAYVDMHKVYLRSVKSPHVQGKRQEASRKLPSRFDVCSQMVDYEDGNDTYAESDDSFVVSNDCVEFSTQVDRKEDGDDTLMMMPRDHKVRKKKRIVMQESSSEESSVERTPIKPPTKRLNVISSEEDSPVSKQPKIDEEVIQPANESKSSMKPCPVSVIRYAASQGNASEDSDFEPIVPHNDKAEKLVGRNDNHNDSDISMNDSTILQRFLNNETKPVTSTATSSPASNSSLLNNSTGWLSRLPSKKSNPKLISWISRGKLSTRGSRNKLSGNVKISDSGPSSKSSPILRSLLNGMEDSSVTSTSTGGKRENKGEKLDAPSHYSKIEAGNINSYSVSNANSQKIQNSTSQPPINGDSSTFAKTSTPKSFNFSSAHCETNNLPPINSLNPPPVKSHTSSLNEIPIATDFKIFKKSSTSDLPTTQSSDRVFSDSLKLPSKNLFQSSSNASLYPSSKITLSSSVTSKNVSSTTTSSSNPPFSSNTSKNLSSTTTSSSNPPLSSITSKNLSSTTTSSINPPLSSITSKNFSSSTTSFSNPPLSSITSKNLSSSTTSSSNPPLPSSTSKDPPSNQAFHPHFLTILVNSAEVSSGGCQIASTLRQELGASTFVCSIVEADYILSTRMAALRLDFLHYYLYLCCSFTM